MNIAPKLKKRLLWVFLLPLGCLLVCGGLLYYFLIHRCNDSIRFLVNKETKGRYAFEAGEAEISLWDRTLHLTNISLSCLDTTQVNTYYNLRIPELYLSLHSWKDPLFHKKIIVDSLSIIEPWIDLYTHPINPTNTPAGPAAFKTADIVTTLEKILLHFNVRSFSLKDASFNYTLLGARSPQDPLHDPQPSQTQPPDTQSPHNQSSHNQPSHNQPSHNQSSHTQPSHTQSSQAKSPHTQPPQTQSPHTQSPHPQPFHADHINIAVSNFKEVNNEDSHLLGSDKVSISLGKQHWVFPDGQHVIDFTRLTFNSKGQRFELDSLTYTQKTSPHDSDGNSNSNGNGNGNGTLTLRADKLFFNSRHLPAIYQKQQLLLDTLTCINPVLSIPLASPPSSATASPLKGSSHKASPSATSSPTSASPATSSPTSSSPATSSATSSPRTGSPAAAARKKSTSIFPTPDSTKKAPPTNNLFTFINVGFIHVVDGQLLLQNKDGSTTSTATRKANCSIYNLSIRPDTSFSAGHPDSPLRKAAPDSSRHDEPPISADSIKVDLKNVEFITRDSLYKLSIDEFALNRTGAIFRNVRYGSTRPGHANKQVEFTAPSLHLKDLSLVDLIQKHIKASAAILDSPMIVIYDKGREPSPIATSSSPFTTTSSPSTSSSPVATSSFPPTSSSPLPTPPTVPAIPSSAPGPTSSPATAVPAVSLPLSKHIAHPAIAENSTAAETVAAAENSAANEALSAGKMELFYRALHNISELIDTRDFNILHGTASYKRTGHTSLEAHATDLNAHILLNKFFNSDSLVDIKHAIPDLHIAGITLASKGTNITVHDFRFDGVGRHSVGKQLTIHTPSGLDITGENIYWHIFDWDIYQKDKDIQIDSIYASLLTIHTPPAAPLTNSSANPPVNPSTPSQPDKSAQPLSPSPPSSSSSSPQPAGTPGLTAPSGSPALSGSPGPSDKSPGLSTGSTPPPAKPLAALPVIHIDRLHVDKLIFEGDLEKSKSHLRFIAANVHGEGIQSKQNSFTWDHLFLDGNDMTLEGPKTKTRIGSFHFDADKQISLKDLRFESTGSPAGKPHNTLVLSLPSLEIHTTLHSSDLSQWSLASLISGTANLALTKVAEKDTLELKATAHLLVRNVSPSQHPSSFLFDELNVNLTNTRLTKGTIDLDLPESSLRLSKGRFIAAIPNTTGPAKTTGPINITVSSPSVTGPSPSITSSVNTSVPANMASPDPTAGIQPARTGPSLSAALLLTWQDAGLIYQKNLSTLSLNNFAGSVREDAFEWTPSAKINWQDWLAKTLISSGRLHIKTPQLTAGAETLTWNIPPEPSSLTTSSPAIVLPTGSLPTGSLPASSLPASSLPAVFPLNTRAPVNTLHLGGLSLVPTKSREAAFQSATWQNDYISLKGGDLTLTGIRFPSPSGDSLLHVHSLALDGINLDVSRDKNISFRHGFEKPMPTKLINTIPLPLRIDSILISNTNVIYNERSVATGNWSAIPIDTIHGYLLNISNRHTMPDTLQISVAGQLFDSYIRHFSYNESYGDSLSAFSARSYFSAIDLTKFSQVSIPAAALSVTGGYADTAYSGWDGNKYASFGSMNFYYEHLKLKVLNRKDIHKKAFLPSIETWLVNLILPSRRKRSSAIFVERDREKFVFNYWVKAQTSGLLSTVGIKKSRAYRRLYKKKYKEYSLPENPTHP